MKKRLRIVVVGKHAYNDHKTLKSAISICKRNVKAGYFAYITEWKLELNEKGIA